MSFRDFIGQMEEKAEVLHVKEPVSTKFEISYFMKSFDNNGPILSFDKVKNHGGRVVANTCGTRKRICSALSVDEKNL
jgi:UbiD family decarboxylase